MILSTIQNNDKRRTHLEPYELHRLGSLITMLIIKRRDTDKPTCSVNAENSVFGDPCVGTFKYLTVCYECPGDVVCEHDTLSLSCTGTDVLSIISASFGRSDYATCANGPIQTTTCDATSSLSVVEDLCHGMSSCSIDAENSVFGDPCVGTFKYLTVEYECTPADPLGNFVTDTSCHGQPLTLSCSNDHVLEIEAANYGRTAGPEVCPHNAVSDQNCGADSSLSVVSRACNGRTDCTVAVNKETFGGVDPCYGTYKYLEVSSRCTPADPLGNFVTDTSCHGQPLTLSCSNDHVLEIEAANYGRTAGPEVCPHNAVSDQNCGADSSLSVVSRACNGRTDCTVAVNKETFGGVDPCYGTYKYLEVSSRCTPADPCGNFVTEIACHSQTLSISCTTGVIEIGYANYGRTAGKEVCSHNAVTDQDCHAGTSLAVVTAACDGQTNCNVVASNPTFGGSDPCFGTYKYLEVSYRCTTC
ncbi:rhamnose-binding lectin-like [Glandiceps talaboti]